MNSTSTTIRKAIAASAAAAAIFSMAACGSEIQAPTNDIGKSQQQQAPKQGHRTSIPRGSFNDEYGQAKNRQHPSTPAGSGTRNRMDFRDRGF